MEENSVTKDHSLQRILAIYNALLWWYLLELLNSRADASYDTAWHPCPRTACNVLKSIKLLFVLLYEMSWEATARQQWERKGTPISFCMRGEKKLSQRVVVSSSPCLADLDSAWEITDACETNCGCITWSLFFTFLILKFLVYCFGNTVLHSFVWRQLCLTRWIFNRWDKWK